MSVKCSDYWRRLYVPLISDFLIAVATTHAVATALKPSFGHMLAASGIIETIGALLAMKHQAVPPTLNSNAESANLPVPLVTKLEERPVRTLLKLSTGFTGHDAAILIAKSKDV